ncbi:MAG: tetratricopeptide repeat protein, partial [Planctomycetes bacterium]|nr:tetratricopeptide repeat protein [Planctomycetota bacterium]
MAVTAVLMLALFAQDPVFLEIGKPIEGAIDVDSPVSHTPTLDANYTAAPTVGIGFQLVVPESGPYTIELRSYDFDAYLVVTQFDGSLLTEDDDGLLNTHARVVIDLEANHKYVVKACALHGGRGKFQLQLLGGSPAPLSPQDQQLAAEDDLIARLRHIEFTIGKETAEYAVSQNFLGIHYFNRGDYTKAQVEWENALRIREIVLGPGHPDTATSLNNLAFLLQSQSNYEEARPLYERALAISEKVLGPEHPQTATSLNNLAGLFESQGNYEEARPLYDRSLAILEKVLGPEHPDTARGLNSLAGLLESQGNYEEARPLYERALAINEKVLGQEHPDTATSLYFLAGLLEFQGNYEEARLLHERALVIREKVLGPEHPDTALSLNNLAVLLQSQGNYEEARPLYERGLVIMERALGTEHPSTAGALNNLAHLLQSQGSYEEAQPLQERALAIWNRVLGPEHPNTTLALSNLASLLQSSGNYEKALPVFLRALSGSLAHLDRELPSMSEAERLRLLEIYANPENLLSCLVRLALPDPSESYSLFLKWKGKATRLQEASIQLGQASHTPEIRKRREQIQVQAKKLSGLVFLPLANQSDEHAERIDNLRKERIRLERELNRDLGLDLVLATPSLIEVQAGLPEGAVLVDFFVGEMVYAYVLAGHREPRLILVGVADSLRASQEAFLRGTAIRGGRSLTKEDMNSKQHYISALWDPLRKEVGDASQVFVSPDGFLCELPFGILQETDGSYLLEKHQFVYLTDPTRIAELSESATEAEGSLLAVGDVNYFLRDDAPKDVEAKATTRSRIGASWNSLPATRDELQSLRDLHDFILEWESPMTVVKRKAATEERIRMELPGHRYIHIATHGYFEPDHLPSL